MKIKEEFLPDFITMTNACEKAGYLVKFNMTPKGVLCDVYLNTKKIHTGKKYFDGCLLAQKESYSQIYKRLVNN
jgi:hypothetical protein